MRWPLARMVLLPILGGIAGVLAFQLASPFESSLERPGLDLTSPEAQFTFGTSWGTANRAAFGFLICGLLALGLTLGRKSTRQAIMVAGLAALVGALVNTVTDSASDLIGLAIAKHAGMAGNAIADLAWCVLVPLGISFTLAFASGFTPERIRRAKVATATAAIASLGAQMIVGVLAVPSFSGGLGADTTLRSFIPMWRIQEIATGIAIGLVMAFVDRVVRSGALRLVLGTKEFRDWSLDDPISRIGTAEESEIPLRGFRGVERQHACIAHQGSDFILDASGETLINGVHVQRAALHHGDTIQVGDATLLFLTFEPAKWMAMIPGRREGPRQMAAVLIDSAGGQFHLPPGKYGIGRDPTNTIFLSGQSSVSRKHAEITVSPGGVELVDLGSANGTRVNGQPLAGPVALRPGDSVEFGSARFTFGLY